MTMDETQTTAYKIFHRSYYCYIQQIHLYSDDYIENVGIVTTGDRALDKQISQEWILCGKPISELAEMHYEGIAIKLHDTGRDAPEIYELVMAHIDEMEAMIKDRSVLFVENELVERQLRDIQLLEEFARDVYPIAAKKLQVKPRASTLSAFFGQSKRVARMDNVGPQRHINDLPDQRRSDQIRHSVKGR